MKKILLIFISANLITTTLFAQKSIGKICFTNGSTKEIYEVVSLNISLGDDNLSSSDKIIISKVGIRVHYQDSNQTIPFSKLDFIEVKQWENSILANSPFMVENASIWITTKSGIEITSTYIFLTWIEVKVFDSVIEEITTQKFWFGNQGKLNIKWINFY